MKNSIDYVWEYFKEMIRLADGNVQSFKNLAIERYDECLFSVKENFDFDVYEYLCCRVVNCIDGAFIYENMDKKQYKEYESEMNKKFKQSKYYDEFNYLKRVCESLNIVNIADKDNYDQMCRYLKLNNLNQGGQGR